MDEELIVLGFDGMDIHILEEAMEKRELPNFERLREEGVLGTLKSTHPPVTIPAWISMFTGKDPGNLGAFHFQRLNTDTGRFESNDVTQYFGTYVWDSGVESALLFVPGTSPPYEINGRMVEGVPGPADFSTFPAGLKEELVDEEDIDDLENENPDYTEKIMTKYRVRRKAIHKALEDYSQELFIAVYRPTDHIPHQTDDVEELYDLYEIMDEELGYFIEHAESEGADLLVVSDHGTSVTDTVFFPNTWLHEKGYLELSGEGESARGSRAVSAASQLANLGLSKPLYAANRLLSRLFGIDFRESKHAVADQVEWHSSRAMGYLIGSPPSTGIMLNEEVVGDELEEVRDEIIAELEEEDVVEWARPREEVYTGDRIDELPHIVVRCSDTVMLKSNINPRPLVKYDNLGHGYYGVLGGLGPSLAPVGKSEADIPDIAPTLMHLLDRKVPEDMDGRVLEELLELDREVVYGDPIDRDVEAEKSQDEDVKDRLEELGYIRD